MDVRCYNCDKDLNQWNVGRDGRRVLGPDCTSRLVLGIENPFGEHKKRPPKVDIPKE